MNKEYLNHAKKLKTLVIRGLPINNKQLYFEQELYKIKDKYERVAEDGTPDYPITWGEPDWNSLVETFIARRNQNKSLVED